MAVTGTKLEVQLSGSLREFAGGATTVTIDARTVRELLRKLVERYPRMQSRVDAGIAVSINGEIFRDDRNEEIPSGAEVFLLPRIQGG
jgi:sulfur-carrier protein